ncbi:T9SS type A sorting domain-containing protein [Mangrovibacterium sp.]|uniref:T9SS type A sorting domain-containing protein n=1 Tax=Mangrovibacterium sp. TaxID=1961364 RepID=UPI0035620428
MKQIFTFLIIALLLCLVNNTDAGPFKKTKSPDSRNLLTTNQVDLKSATITSQPDSVAFYDWDQGAWKLIYTSSYLYDGSLQVQDMSYIYNDNGTAVEYINRTTTEYDNSSRPSIQVIQTYNGSEYINLSRSYYSYYNDTHMTTLILSESWDDGSWVASSRQKTNYDDKGNETSYIMEYGFSGTWMISFGDSTKYEYDGNKIVMETYLEYSTSGMSGSWQPYEKWVYTWTGDLATSAIVSEYKDGQWVEKEKYVDVTWNNPGGVDLMSEPSYYRIQVMKSEVWTDSLRVTNTYDGTVQTRIEQEWLAEAWVNRYKTVFDYESIDLMTADYLEYEWSGTLSDWVLTDGLQFINSYEKSTAEGRLISSITQWYDQTSEQWLNYSKMEYFYDSTTDVQTLLSGRWISVFPNPSTGMLNLKFDDAADKIQIDVFNSAGVKVFIDQVDKPNIGYTYSKDLQNLNKGLYFIRIQSNNKTETLKFILR